MVSQIRAARRGTAMRNWVESIWWMEWEACGSLFAKHVVYVDTQILAIALFHLALLE